MTDKELINKIKNGNEPAFDALFRKYYASLARFAMMFTKNEDNADEIVQSFFVRLWEQKEGLKINSSVKSYFYTSVRNTALNFLKKEKTRNIYQKKHEAESKNDILDIENNKITKIYETAVNNLPERTKEVFVLSKNEGLTYKEIADYLQISAKTVENNMGIAFKKLREMLMPYKHLIYK